MAGTKTESTRRRRGKHSGSALISRRLPARSASVHRGTGHSLFRVKSGTARTACFKGAGLQTPLHLCRGGRGCVLWACLQMLRCLCWGDRNCLLHGVGLALARGVGQLNSRRNQAFLSPCCAYRPSGCAGEISDFSPYTKPSNQCMIGTVTAATRVPLAPQQARGRGVGVTQTHSLMHTPARTSLLSPFLQSIIWVVGIVLRLPMHTTVCLRLYPSVHNL